MLWLGRFTEGKNCLQVRMVRPALKPALLSPGFHWDFPPAHACCHGMERDNREALGGILRGIVPLTVGHGQSEIYLGFLLSLSLFF